MHISRILHTRTHANMHELEHARYHAHDHGSEHGHGQMFVDGYDDDVEHVDWNETEGADDEMLMTMNKLMMTTFMNMTMLKKLIRKLGRSSFL